MRLRSEAVERDLIFDGTVGMIDPPREEAAVAISEARRAGIRVVMITGADDGLLPARWPEHGLRLGAAGV